jgi:NAD(P)-dependent dehydrogenase (short-subunit alcohol dehydrogenase family)
MVNEPALRAATEDLADVEHQAMSVTCDVSDENQVADMVDQAVARFGRLDMAFNNAGIMVAPTSAAEESAEQFDRVNAVKLRGVWVCMNHEAAPDPPARHRGPIVNNSSLGGLVGLPERAAYHATEHGIIGLTKSAALEYAPQASASTRSARERSRPRWWRT